MIKCTSQLSGRFLKEPVEEKWTGQTNEKKGGMIDEWKDTRALTAVDGMIQRGVMRGFGCCTGGSWKTTRKMLLPSTDLTDFSFSHQITDKFISADHTERSRSSSVYISVNLHVHKCCKCLSSHTLTLMPVRCKCGQGCRHSVLYSLQWPICPSWLNVAHKISENS